MIRRAQAGEAPAMERLLLSHLNLALVEARRLGVAADLLDDVVQDAAEALIRATARFDPARGTRFNTFARWSVREAVSAHLRRREIPLPLEVAAVHHEPDLPLSVDALELLDTETRQVVLLRFGFVDGHPRSERDTARLLGWSRHRVRTLEGEAMTRLRHRLASVGSRAPAGADPL